MYKPPFTKEEIKQPEISETIFTEIADKLETYKINGHEGKMGFIIDDPKIWDMWNKKIKPLSEKISPVEDELIAIDEERAQLEAKYKEIMERRETAESKLKTLMLQKNQFINRISPIVIKKYGANLNKYQQLGSVIEDNGTLYVTVIDFLATFMSGWDKKKEKHEEKVGSKISPKMQTAE